MKLSVVLAAALLAGPTLAQEFEDTTDTSDSDAATAAEADRPDGTSGTGEDTVVLETDAVPGSGDEPGADTIADTGPGEPLDGAPPDEDRQGDAPADADEMASDPDAVVIPEAEPDAEEREAEPLILETDRPVVVMPDDDREAAEDAEADATPLADGVGGDVQPKMIAPE